MFLFMTDVYVYDRWVNDQHITLCLAHMLNVPHKRGKKSDQQNSNCLNSVQVNDIKSPIKLLRLLLLLYVSSFALSPVAFIQILL